MHDSKQISVGVSYHISLSFVTESDMCAALVWDKVLSACTCEKLVKGHVELVLTEAVVRSGTENILSGAPKVSNAVYSLHHSELLMFSLNSICHTFLFKVETRYHLCKSLNERVSETVYIHYCWSWFWGYNLYVLSHSSMCSSNFFSPLARTLVNQVALDWSRSLLSGWALRPC